MSKKIVVTRPEHDETTKYLSHYAKLVIKFASERGIFVRDFAPGNVKRDKLSIFIQKQKPGLLFINGHGDHDSIEGEKGEIIIKEGENEKILEGKLTYARSCFAALSLGVKCEEFEEDTCFIGYIYPFQFWFDETRTATPLKDKTALLYLGPSNELVKYLIKGNSARIAFDKSKRLMVENMNKILLEKELGAREKFKALWINYSGQKICGNENLTF